MTRKLLASLFALLLLASVAPLVAGNSGLLPNPDFDDLDDMDIVVGWYELFENVSEMNNITDDADDCSFSGGADGINTSNVDAGGATWSACTDEVVEGQAYQVTGVVRFPFGTSDSYSYVDAIYTSELGCHGSAIDQFFSVPSKIEYTANDWTPFRIDLDPAPAGAKSIRVTVVSVKANATDVVSDVYFDKIYLTPAEFVFSEDFEAGSACRWSQELGLEP